MYFTFLNYHEVLLPSFPSSNTIFSTGNLLDMHLPNAGKQSLQQHSGNTGHGYVFTAYSMRRCSPGKQSSLKNSNTMNKVFGMDTFNLMGPLQRPTEAVPKQDHSNCLTVFSALIQALCKPADNTGFQFFSTNKKVFTVFALLTSGQYIALQSCSSGVTLGKMGLSWYLSGQNDILQFNEDSTRTWSHCPTIIPFFPNHLPYMLRKNRETPLDYTHSSRYIKQESHEARSSLIRYMMFKNHKRILLLVCQLQNASKSCVHIPFLLFHMVQGSGQLEKNIFSSSHWMQNLSLNLLLLQCLFLIRKPRWFSNTSQKKPLPPPLHHVHSTVLLKHFREKYQAKNYEQILEKAVNFK